MTKQDTKQQNETFKDKRRQHFVRLSEVPRCINCIYFTRDYKDGLLREKLENDKTGYCMFNPPERVLILLANTVVGAVSIPPIVDESRFCSQFKSNDK